MCTEHEDRWAELNDPAAVADAVERLRQFASAPSEQAARQRVLDLLAPAAGEHVLDVGAGIGDLSLKLLQRVQPGGRVTALDASSGLLELARSHAREAGLDSAMRFDTGDARHLPYGDEQFDIAFCHWLLLHVPSAEDVLREMVRVTRPGGRVMCVEVDWGTMTIRGGNPDMTRRIVRANVERQVDGRVGRRLGSLFQCVGLHNIRVEPITDTDHEGDEHGWLAFVKSRIPIAVDAGAITGEEGAQWWRALQEAIAEGNYCFSVTQFAAMGERPG